MSTGQQLPKLTELENASLTKTKSESTKNPNAVALGRLGGLVGGKARAEALSKRKRAEIARLAAAARWKKSPYAISIPSSPPIFLHSTSG